MQPLQIVRLGAYGDLLVASSTFPFLLKEYSPVSLETNNHGADLFVGDPRFKYVSIWMPDAEDESERFQQCMTRWKEMEDECIQNGTKFLNFWSTIENRCVLHEGHADIFMDRADKAIRYGRNFYEETFAKAEVKMPDGWIHENTIHFPDAMIRVCERWREKNKENFIMMVAIGGSSRQKVFPTWMQAYCESLIDTYPKLKIYLMGGEELASDVWEYERTFSYVKGTGSDIMFRQAVLMTKYADYVLGGETGLMLGAGMMGTPKTTLCTITDGANQMNNYHRNDLSVQSKADCSPCYVMAYSGEGCPMEPVYNAFPICTHEFDLDKLANIFDNLYTARF